MIDQVLQEAGILLEDIETRLEGQNGKSLIISKRDLLYYDNQRLQRARLREIVNVKTAKTGELSVKSPHESLIEGSIKGFDLAELKFFFEAVKNAIARAKSSATGADMPAPRGLGSLPVAPVAVSVPEPAPAPIAWDSSPSEPTSWDTAAAKSTAWDIPPPPANNAWNAEAPKAWDAAPPKAWMPEKQTFEVGPEAVIAKPSKDSWADLDAELNPAKSGSMPPLLNASAMIPAPRPAKAPIDPFADLARSNPSRSSSADDWGSSSSPKPDNPTGVMVAPSASGEWGGEIMDASTALDGKAKSGKGTPAMRLGDNTAGIEGIARWLRILSIIFLLVGALLPASLLLESNFAPDFTHLALIVVSFFGGLLLPLIGWGVSELLTSWAKASLDLRSIRKATLGH